MDTVKIRELPQKSGISLTDMIIVEDNDGTKTQEVSEFKSLLQQSIYFNTVEDMKNANLKEGDVVNTLGYRDINDGGGGVYKIEYAPTDLNDGILVHYLHTSDTLRAHLVHGGELNILQAGAFGDGVSDDFTFITKAIKTGLPIKFPKRIYKLSGSLDLPSNTTLDLNGATLYCSTSSCICIGLTKDTYNITIQNGNLFGKYGIETYAYARSININNCKFYPSGSTGMDKAIVISGATDISINNCIIGSSNRQVNYGIYMSSGQKAGNTIGNHKITILNNVITAVEYGIDMTSTKKDRSILISGNTIIGYAPSSSAKTNTAIQISSNSDSIIVSSCNISGYYHGLIISGVVDVTVSITDIICDDVWIMYSILSDSANVYLSGLQKLNAGPDNNTDSAKKYIFGRMTGKLYLNTSFETTAISSKVKIAQAGASLAGDLIDSMNPIIRNKITLTAASQLNSNLDNTVPGYMNIALDLNYAGDIADLPFPSLNGQLVAVYSSSGAKLKHNSNILLGQDIILNRYTPVIVKNINGLWTRVN